MRWEDALLPRWMDKVASAVRADPVGLDAAEALVEGPGWYRCWLRFWITLARAQNAPVADRDAAVEEALAQLTGDLNPFAGDPRACDLHPIHGTVQASVYRAVAAISDADAWERAVGVVRRVSDAVATTMFGEVGGPLPSDWLMRLTIRTAPASKLATVRALARARTEQSAARYYSDIAEARLFAARAELAAGERDEAKVLWTQACRLLVAYGWHKDSTVYELLNPFPALTGADPRRARLRLPAVQAVCERVWQHTDGRGTRGAPGRWWELLAAADPIALAGLVAPTVHARCNEPDDHLHDALAELWRAWSGSADPFVAATLRLTISPPSIRPTPTPSYGSPRQRPIRRAGRDGCLRPAWLGSTSGHPGTPSPTATRSSRPMKASSRPSTPPPGPRPAPPLSGRCPSSPRLPNATTPTTDPRRPRRKTSPIGWPR